jgi:hypothetical protein
MARERIASTGAMSAGGHHALGTMAAEAEPEQNAQCDEACLGDAGRGFGAELGDAAALR